MNSVVLVQARTGSTRLPGKVLLPIGDEPMVLHVLRRASLIGPPVILATSDDRSDDDLAGVAVRAGFTVRRGSRDDVLGRFVSALPDGVQTVVRVTADCPLFDPAVGRTVLGAIEASGIDYASNTLPPTFPDGLDCWAVRAEALGQAHREATLPSDREHVMPFIWRQPERFRIWNLAHVPDLSAERWTVDDERDLAFVREVHALLADLPPAARTSMYAVLAALERRPDVRALNAGTIRDEGYARSLARDPKPAAGPGR